MTKHLTFDQDPKVKVNMVAKIGCLTSFEVELVLVVVEGNVHQSTAQTVVREH